MRLAVAVAVVFAAAGCRTVDVELFPRDGGSGDGSCSGVGAPRVIAGVCAGAWAASAHRFALCSCDALTLSGSVRSGAFDSTGAVPGAIASVGANGAVSGNANVFLSGALWSAGSVTVGVQLETIGSLHAGGAFSAVGAEGSVGGDAFVDGDVSGPIEVHGTLHLPQAAMVGTGVNAPTVVREPVAIAPPCDCTGAQQLDLAGELAAAAAANDDATIGLATGALGPGALDLPCGRYSVDSIALDSALTLRVHGRATLSVTHDLALGGSLDVVLDQDAELDIVVGGALRTSAAVEVGDAAAPARVRVWVAGNAAMQLDGDPTLHAVVTVPQAGVTAPVGVTVDGSLLAASFGAGATMLRYDAAILSSGAACGASPVAPVE